MPGQARRGRAYRLRDAAPDRMSAADWPGQNSSPEAETSRQEAAASSKHTTLSAAMAPAATNFRLPLPAPEERLSAPPSASPVATTTRRGPACARASRSREVGVWAWPGGVARGGAGRGPSRVPLPALSPGCKLSCLLPVVAESGTGPHPVPTEQQDARHSSCRVPWFGRR